MAVSANWLHSPSRLCHREGAFTQFTFQNGQESRKWLTIQICHVLNAWEAKKPLYGTKNLSKGAKTRVRVLADIQNFALRAHCVRTACALRAWHSPMTSARWKYLVQGTMPPTPNDGPVAGYYIRGRGGTLYHAEHFSFSQFQPWMSIILTRTHLVLLSISNVAGAVLCLPRVPQSVVPTSGASHMSWMPFCAPPYPLPLMRQMLCSSLVKPAPRNGHVPPLWQMMHWSCSARKGRQTLCQSLNQECSCT